MSFSTRAFLLLVLVNVCRAGWFFGPSATATGCKQTALDAAMNGDLKGIQSCLNVGWDVNAKSNVGWTALHFAAKFDKVDVIAALIKAGADVNAKDNNGWTALHHKAVCFVVKCRVNVIAALIKADANVNAKANNGWTALQTAAKYGNMNAVAALIKAGADVNARDNGGFTVLAIATSKRYNYATSKRYSEIATVLIDSGATTDSKGRDLLQAAKKGELKHVQEALKANANIETKSKDGYTALIYAVAKGHIDIVNFLVDAGADVNAHDIDGVTVLEFATKKGYSEIATVLIDSGAISGLNNKENEAKTRSSHSSKKSKRKKREKKASKCKLLLYHSFIFFKLTHIFFYYLFFGAPNFLRMF